MEFNQLQLDGLREIINIGGGHAATSLAQLTTRRIEMNIPEIDVLAYHEIFNEYLPADTPVYAIYTHIENDLTGAFLLVVSHETATLLVKLMTDNLMQTDELTQSALNELGNIIGNSFLKAIGEMLTFEVTTSLPTVIDDVFGAILTSTYMALEQYDEQILVIRNEFKYAKQNLDASLFFIPTSGNLEKIFDALGLKGE